MSRKYRSDAMASIHETMEALHKEILEKAKALLTPEQKEQLKEKREHRREHKPEGK